MSTSMETVLKKVQSFQLSKAQSVLWIVKRRLRGGVADYSIASVKTHAKLQKKLVDVVARAIRSANHVEEYEFLSEDKDEDAMLSVKLTETDLNQIANTISYGSDNPKVETADQLLDSWAYAIELHVGKERILAVRKIPEGWKLKQKEKRLSALFKNHMLLDFEDTDVFRLDRTIDFFAYHDLVFILDKKKFESAMNFRAGMERNRDGLLDELKELDVVNDVEIIRLRAGTRIGFLRRMSMIKKNGYYKRPGFMKRLKTVCAEKNWPIAFEEEKVVITEDNVEAVLKLLNDDRLASLLTDDIFDVSVKKKVSV